MPNVTDQELQRIINGGESDRVEFKKDLSGDARNAIREAICAFANDLPNHGQPGLIFVGMQYDGKAVGTTIDDELLRQLADMKTDGNVVPPPSLTVEKRELAGGEVAVVIVQPSDSPPVRCLGAIYVRIGPRRGIATAQDERTLNEKRRHGDRPFDVRPIPDTGLSDLNLTSFTYDYLPRAFSEEVLAANDRSLEEQLAATKMILAADEPTTTVTGILTLGKNPQDFLPGAYMQFLRINGDAHGDEVIDAKTIRGAIPDMLRQLEDKLAAHNRTAVDITSGYLERRTQTYPLEALHQIIRNAVMHRTYEATNAPIHVYWFNDRIEVMSPGVPSGR